MGHGVVRIHLEELIQKSGMSKNQVSHLAAMERTQLNNYCKNKVSRVDLDVLARLCTAPDCSIGELLEFLPEK